MNYKQKLLSIDRFIDNMYLDLYINLIECNLDTAYEKYITQKHHVIPRYIFRSLDMNIDNSKENLVNLKFKDHILAHYYLALCSTNSKDRYCNELAILRMIGDSELPLADRYWIEHLDKYQELYKDAQLHNRDAHLGKPSWNKGLKYHRTPTKESTKELISNKAKNRYKDHIWIHKGNINKHIDRSLLDVYLNDGFEIGRNQVDVFKKISESQKLNPNRSMLGKKQSDNQKRLASEKLRGVPKSDKARQNMSKAKKGKILVSNDVTKHSFFINKEELSVYLEKGYHKGKLSQTNKTH